MCFVELKRPGGRLSDLQLIEIKKFRDLGFDVAVIDTLEGVKDWVDKHTRHTRV